MWPSETLTFLFKSFHQENELETIREDIIEFV